MLDRLSGQVQLVDVCLMSVSCHGSDSTHSSYSTRQEQPFKSIILEYLFNRAADDYCCTSLFMLWDASGLNHYYCAGL